MKGSRRRKPGRGIDATGRTAAGQRFIKLDHWILDCPAWNALSPDGRAVLIAIWKRYNAQNNGRIPFSTREAQSALCGSGTHRALKALRDGQDKGFLRCRRLGGFNLKGTNPASEWEVTALPVPGPDGAPAAKDYAKWHPEKNSTVAESTTRRCQNDNPNGEDTPSRIAETTTRKPDFPESGLSIQQHSYLPCGRGTLREARDNDGQGE